MEVVSDSHMREDEEATTPARNLEVSISFGRFENDLLSWEKWSSFSQNKYLEEVEKCATPGSVAAKKAYFEARNKLIAVRKAEVLNKQMEACQETQENDFQNTHVSEVYDEEVTEENIFGSEMSSPGMNEHPEVETNIFVPQEPNMKDVIKATSTNQLISGESTLGSEMSSLGMNGQPDIETNFFMSQAPDEKDVIEAVSSNELPSGLAIFGSETKTPLIANLTKKDFTLFISESDKLKKDNTYETIKGSSEFDVFDGRSLTEGVQEEQISELEHQLSGCATDKLFNTQSCVSGSAQADVVEQVGQPFEIISKFDVYNDAPEDIKVESIVKIALSPSMLDQFNVDDAGCTKSPLPIEDKYAKSKFAEDITALKPARITRVGESPSISGVNNAQSAEVKPRMQNSSKKIFPANKQNSAENVKKTLVSRVPGSPQMLTPKTSKPLIPTVKSASRSLPVSNVKRTPTSAPAARKSDQVPNITRSTIHSPVSSMKPSSLSQSKKGSDLLSSKKKFVPPVVSQKPTPKSLHMSLNFGSKVSSSILGSVSVTEPRKSLFLEKMGDKDIVKRAFRAFQYISTPINIDTNATSKKVVRDKTVVTPSTKDRLITKSEVDVRSKKSASIYTNGNKNQSKEDKRNEGTFTGDRRQSFINKAATQPGLHNRHSSSKSFQDKDVTKS